MAVKTGTNNADYLTDLVAVYSFFTGAQVGWIDRNTDDTVNGLDGDDLIILYNGNDIANGGNGHDSITDFGTGHDVMTGGYGNDHFYIGVGNNIVDGGYDHDWAHYDYRSENVLVDLGREYGRGAGEDRLISIESASGGTGHDVLVGSAAANTLFGGYGNDHLVGMRGNDILQGGRGDDRLTGDGSGSSAGPRRDSDRDTFVFDDNDFAYPYEVTYDVITDFRRGEDRIDVRGVDADPTTGIDDYFTFDDTPDSAFEEWVDGLDNLLGFTQIRADGSPVIDGDPQEIEYRHVGGNTFIYLSTADGETNADIMLVGTHYLTADDFIL
jgi:Ca2+-binding RTX toxin-like protein